MALVTIRRSPSVQTPRSLDEADKTSESDEGDAASRISKSLNECCFANKGAAVVLGGERPCSDDRHRSPARAPQPDIQHHLQAMFCLLRPEETLKMAVKLESAHSGRTRYLVVVCRSNEAALLGIDCNELTTVGLVIRVLADTSIKLDGDGGFSVCVCNQQHIFKPVSVQAMWSALQTLHRASAQARQYNHFAGGSSHSWASYYEERIDSDRSCLNEWHAMDCIESRRPPSPDSLRLKPRERDETERVIRCTLKEIMMSVDLDEVTSKVIRGRLEDELDMDLAEYKSFIDQEMLTILGQMDEPTKIFDHVYLGSEWNASNLEELQRNGVTHILNVTREIDNFFPGTFDYLNVRVYDDEKTDLLKHWDNTFKYINKARTDGSKVLVHCKMGISRSASVVIAYAMKAYNWNFDKALKHVKTKRSCIKPNTNFLGQLETYQGILDAMKNKEKLQRSKSETNLKTPKASAAKGGPKAPTTSPLALALAGGVGRPRSWSPDTRLAGELLPPTSVSLESLAAETRHMLMPCAGGSYSVSPNQIIRLKGDGAPCVRHIVNEIESATADRRDLTRRYQRLLFGAPPETEPARAPWDPGEPAWPSSRTEDIVKSDSGIVDAKTKSNDALSGEELPMPSRAGSCSSLDSAVVADVSRHSSWGSGDTRAARAAPDLASISEHAHISDNERKFNETCAILEQLAAAGATAGVRGSWAGRLSASAPAATWLRAGPRRRRLAAASHGDLPTGAPPPAGLVSNLKKEFEARSGAADADSDADVECAARRSLKSRSLPAEREDVSVRVLVDRYDRGRPGGGPGGGPGAALLPPHDAASKKSRLAWEPRAGPAPGERPPLAPTVLALAPLDYPDVVVSTVMSKAQKKQLQHGKTHPLTRLNMNRSTNRCSNPVYNTM